MLELQSVSFKNFLSVANNPVKFTLTDFQNNLIIGKNGCGKSLICDAITFALFGKPFRKVNKTQLVNTMTKKDTVVILNLIHNGKRYKIKRGIKPNILEITVDGKQRQMLSSVKDEQDWLETNLQLNYKTFIHIVILGNCNYVPFMEKSASDRRNFIEDTLGLSEYTAMKLVTKEKIKQINNDIKDVNKDINSYRGNENILKRSIDNLERVIQKQAEEKEAEIQEYKDELLELRDNLIELRNKHSNLNGELALLGEPSSTIMNLQQKIRRLENKKKDIKVELDVYTKHEHCPTCKQALAIDVVKAKLEELYEKCKEINEQIDLHKLDIEKNETLLEEYNNVASNIKEYELKIYNTEQSTKRIVNKLKTLKQPLKTSDDLEEMQIELEQVRAKCSSLQERLDELDDELQLHETICDSYDPVKKNTISTYIPIINNFLNKYLKILGLDATFKFDEDFNEKIDTRYKEDYSYTSFSEGEKMRINLALLLTWREVCKLKNSFNCNLLILDEVCDSSLDVEGMGAFLELIKQLGGNVYIISHRDEVVTEDFDNIIRVDKKRSTYLKKVKA